VDQKKKKKLRDGWTEPAYVDAVDDLICSLDGNSAIGVDLENSVGTLGLDSNFRKEWILDLGEFVDAVADGIVVVTAAVVFFAEIFVDAKLTLVS